MLTLKVVVELRYSDVDRHEDRHYWHFVVLYFGFGRWTLYVTRSIFFYMVKYSIPGIETSEREFDISCEHISLVAVGLTKPLVF